MKRVNCLICVLLCFVLALTTGCATAESPAPTGNPAGIDAAGTAAPADEPGSAQTEETPAPPARQPAERLPITPGSDGVISVLVIGNSFSTGWQDELGWLLRAADDDIIFYAAAHSGSSLSQHREWMQADAAEYHLRSYTKKPDEQVNENPVTLDHCLSLKEWDAISIQEAYFDLTTGNCDEAALRKTTLELAADVYDHIRELCPTAALLWHQTWALEVGWEKDGQSVPTQEDQDRMYRAIRDIGDAVAAENGAWLVPTGTAFQIARQNGAGDLTRDGCHDSAETGGQYLNACVWFDFITGQSVVGHPWKPSSKALTAEKIALLQEAAHSAVEEYRGK